MIRKWKKRICRKEGFTLIELIVVVAILGMLAATLVPSVSGVVSTAKANAAKTDAQAAFTAAQLAALDAQNSVPLAALASKAGNPTVFAQDSAVITRSLYWSTFPSTTKIIDLTVDSTGNVTSVTVQSANTASAGAKFPS